MYLMAITAARTSIDMSASYFVPDDLTMRALSAAAKRGVKVRIITPGKEIDSDVVRLASRERWGDMLKAGVEIAEYQPTMYHVKALIVDSLMVSVGSTNFDNRSFSINDEANLNVLDPDFARAQVAIFNDDWQRARRMTLTAWQNRSWMEKFSGEIASLLGSQL
jgi:cardiolipin synthase